MPKQSSKTPVAVDSDSHSDVEHNDDMHAIDCSDFKIDNYIIQ